MNSILVHNGKADTHVVNNQDVNLALMKLTKKDEELILMSKHV